MNLLHERLGYCSFYSEIAPNSWGVTLGLLPYRGMRNTIPRWYITVWWTWPLRSWPKVQCRLITRRKLAEKS